MILTEFLRSATPIPAYRGDGTHGNHLARCGTRTQTDVVSLCARARFGGEWPHRDQFWLLLEGEGTLSRDTALEGKLFRTMDTACFERGESRLFIARTAARLLIVESDDLNFYGPWVDWHASVQRGFAR
jgi:hypothetical protein